LTATKQPGLTVTKQLKFIAKKVNKLAVTKKLKKLTVKVYFK